MSTTADYRYGFYLRPDLEMCRAVADAHALLRSEYGLVTGGLFMPHVTIKGFFASDAEPAEMIARLDRSLAGLRPFTAWNGGVRAFSTTSLVISVRDLPDGTPNEGFFDAQDRAFDALLPLVRPGCEWTRRDPRGRSGPSALHAHITLAMADLPAELQAEVRDFILAGGPIGPASFAADTYHLFRFAADWAGDPWHTLSWKLLHSWRMG